MHFNGVNTLHGVRSASRFVPTLFVEPSDPCSQDPPIFIDRSFRTDVDSFDYKAYTLQSLINAGIDPSKITIPSLPSTPSASLSQLSQLENSLPDEV